MWSGSEGSLRRGVAGETIRVTRHLRGLDPPFPRVVVDCDPGIDDALALLMLARLHHQGRMVLDSVVAVAGNAGVEQTAANARFVLERAGLPEIPVFAGAGGALHGLPEPVDASA
jgi:inosine-uridine nucleoside N-ribohydrolase